MAVRDLTAARVRELLNYDPETGVLTWRNSRNGVRAGAVAGRPRRKGYILVSLDGTTCQGHRVAWAAFHGRWPNQIIDHINGVKGDNRIVNLRDVPPVINVQNQRRAMSSNKVGVLGVRQIRKGKWDALLTTGGKQKFLGTYNTVEEAHEAYKEAKRVHHAGCTI